MPISKKPAGQPQQDPDQPDELAIQAIIHRGGSVPHRDNAPTAEEVKPKNIQLRLYPDQIEAIDHIITQKRGNRRRPRQSRHSWLLEAIEEKIDREIQPQ